MMDSNKNTIKETLEEDLLFWMDDTDASIIDDVMEFLIDRNLLTDRGKELYHDFWARYIKEK